MRLISSPLRTEATSSETTKGRVGPFVVVAVAALITSGCGGGGGDHNTAPAIGSTSFSTSEDTPLSGTLTATDADGDAVTFAKASDPTKGTVTVDASGAFVYTPNANYNGSDSFGVTITDARGSSVTSTIAVTITAVNDAPTAGNVVTRADGTGLANIDIKTKFVSDPEGDPITLTITDPAVVGTASVNSDGTINLTGLPAGFKGVTRFKYKAADPSGASNEATAAIFVGTDPFRVAFAGDEAANGEPEVFMTDFVATFSLSQATEGNLRLRSFVAAENGSTIAYMRRDTGTNALDLSFVRTVDTSTQVRIALPSGYALAQGANQYTVSRDGQWIAFLATTSSPTQKTSPFVLNVATPTTLHNVEASSAAIYASTLKFSYDSTYLYLLGSNTSGSQRTLYRTQLSGSGPATAVSQASSSAGNDVSEYLVATDQSRIAITATRGGTVGVYSIDPTAPGTELLLSTDISVPETIDTTTVAKPAGLGNPLDGSKVAYTGSFAFKSAHVANLTGTGGPQLLEPWEAVGLSPNGDALLYRRTAVSAPFQTQIWEVKLANAAADGAVGDGVDAVYDSDQETYILTQQVGSGSSGYNILTTAYNGSLPNTTQIGTAGKAAQVFDLSGAPRAVALIGEAPTSGSVTSVHLALFNARKPDTALFLGSFNSPVDFGSSLATVVTY